MSEKALLSFFWDLASTNEKIRIDAAVGLIDHLTSKESQQKDAVSNTSSFSTDFVSGRNGILRPARYEEYWVK